MITSNSAPSVARSPEKPFSGNFVVRIDPELHRRIAIEAKRRGKSLNTFMAEGLQRTLETQPVRTDAKRRFRKVKVNRKALVK